MPGCCPKLPPANNFDSSMGQRKKLKRLQRESEKLKVMDNSEDAADKEPK